MCAEQLASLGELSAARRALLPSETLGLEPTVLAQGSTGRPPSRRLHFCFLCIFVRQAIPWSAKDGRMSKFPTVGFSSFVGHDPSLFSGHERTTESLNNHSVMLEVNVRQQKFPRRIRDVGVGQAPLHPDERIARARVRVGQRSALKASTPAAASLQEALKRSQFQARVLPIESPKSSRSIWPGNRSGCWRPRMLWLHVSPKRQAVGSGAAPDRGSRLREDLFQLATRTSCGGCGIASWTCRTQQQFGMPTSWRDCAKLWRVQRRVSHRHQIHQWFANLVRGHPRSAIGSVTAQHCARVRSRFGLRGVRVGGGGFEPGSHEEAPSCDAQSDSDLSFLDRFEQDLFMQVGWREHADPSHCNSKPRHNGGGRAASQLFYRRQRRGVGWNFSCSSMTFSVGANPVGIHKANSGHGLPSDPCGWK